MPKKAHTGLFDVRALRAVIDRIESIGRRIAHLLSHNEIVQNGVQIAAAGAPGVAVWVKPFSSAYSPGNFLGARPCGIDLPASPLKGEPRNRGGPIEPDRAKIRVEKAAFEILARFDAQFPAREEVVLRRVRVQIEPGSGAIQIAVE